MCWTLLIFTFSSNNNKSRQKSGSREETQEGNRCCWTRRSYCSLAHHCFFFQQVSRQQYRYSTVLSQCTRITRRWSVWVLWACVCAAWKEEKDDVVIGVYIRRRAEYESTHKHELFFFSLSLFLPEQQQSSPFYFFAKVFFWMVIWRRRRRGCWWSSRWWRRRTRKRKRWWAMRILVVWEVENGDVMAVLLVKMEVHILA